MPKTTSLILGRANKSSVLGRRGAYSTRSTLLNPKGGSCGRRALKDTLKGEAVSLSGGTPPTNCFTATHKASTKRASPYSPLKKLFQEAKRGDLGETPPEALASRSVGGGTPLELHAAKAFVEQEARPLGDLYCPRMFYIFKLAKKTP